MKKSIFKKKNEDINIQNNLNFEEYKNLAASKFHSSKKVNFKTEANELLNISIKEIENSNRRNSYQFAYSTNNKNNYIKFGFCPNSQNVNSKKIDYLLDDEITQLHNKSIYEKILGKNIIKTDKKIKKLSIEMITNKDIDDSDNNRSSIKKRPRNYSFYESKSTKNFDIYNYIETDRTNNDINIDTNYNNTSFYCSNHVRASLTIENNYSSKFFRAESHLDGEVFNNHSIVFITDKSEPFKKSYSNNIPSNLKFESENQTPRDNYRLSLQNNTIENKINSQISELSENDSDNNNKDIIQKEEMIKNNRIIKQKKISHKKEIMKTKNKKKNSPLQTHENKKKKNKNSNIVDQLLSKEFLISINSRNYDKKKNKNMLINLDKNGLIDFHFHTKNENLTEKQIEELKNNLYKSNTNSNGHQNDINLKYNINKNNTSKEREINGINKKSNVKNEIGFEIGEKEIFYNKVNKSNRIKMNKNQKGNHRKYNSYNRYNKKYNINSNKRNNKKPNRNSTLSISQKMRKYTGIKNKTIEEINNNSFKNVNKIKNKFKINFTSDNGKKIGEYKNKTSKNDSKDYNTYNRYNINLGNYKNKKSALTINKFPSLDEHEKKDLKQNNYNYTGSDEELKIILNDNPETNNDSNKIVRNKQIISFIYKKKEIKEKENKPREIIKELNEINCEKKNLPNMNGLNPGSLNGREIRNNVINDMPKNLEIDKYENGGLNRDIGNKKQIYSLNDNLNGDKDYKIGQLENYINKMNNDSEEDILLKDNKITHFNTNSPVYVKSFDENKISKDKSINNCHQKEKEIKGNINNQEHKTINEQFFSDNENSKENKKDNTYNYNNEINNNNKLINNESETLGNSETIKNNTINNSNNDSTSIKELKSEYEFNNNEDKFYKPLNKYENIFNFEKINTFRVSKEYK